VISPARFLAALTAAASLAVVAPASAAIGPDYVTSDNVEYVRSIKTDIGQTTGAKVVGNRLYVTSAKNLSIYDISKPDDPQPIGLLKLNIAWENEEVSTNGKILSISNDWFDLMPSCNIPDPSVTSCLQLFDVRDPTNIKELPAVPQNGDHTSTCLLDCQYLYGSAGSITDLRGVLDGGQPKDLGDWKAPVNAQLAERGMPHLASCHHVREIRPGIIFTACQPFALISINASDGGSITAPKLLATGSNADGRFVHSVRWPREGKDKFAFEGGETNFNPQCSDDNAKFAVLDASKTAETGVFSGPIDEVRPKNGTYVDGNVAANVAGCSVHWFEEHPSFKNGGLVALAEYDNGIRFEQVTPEGKIIEQGYFQPLGFETSSPKWAGKDDIVYSIDYARGIDILRWKGDHYVPTAAGKVKKEKGRVAGTRGVQPVLPALTPSQRAFAVREASLLRASGWFPGFCQLAAERADRQAGT
jgi:hypothetical protein